MTNKPIPARCDAGCQKDFSITKIRARKVKNGIEKNYFRCPHCKHEYVTYYASDETLRLQKDMRKLQRTAYAPGSTYNAIQIQIEEDVLKDKIKRSMDDARAIAEA